MGRRRVDPDERKELITIRLPKKLIDELRSIENYTALVETLLKDHFRKKNSEK